MESLDGSKELGRSLAQLHMKVGALQGVVESMAAAVQSGGGQAGGAPASGDALETTLDLVDAVDAALARRPAPVTGTAPVPRRSWFARRSEPASPAVDESVWSGLALASAAAHERLRAQGLTPVATEGALDPRLHRVVETRGDVAGGAVIERTLRRGWVQEGRVVRVALVVARPAANGGDR